MSIDSERQYNSRNTGDSCTSISKKLDLISKLSEFHNSKTMKKVRYNYAIAQRAEWNRAVNQFMALFGGTIGRHKSNEPHLKDVRVFIGFGDAPNKGNGGRFINYLVKILKALGYEEIFQVNESYTSQYCPFCGSRAQQVKGTAKRKLHCNRCDIYRHRDITAGHNIANILRSQVCY
jgi:hypothetical protein